MVRIQPTQSMPSLVANKLANESVMNKAIVYFHTINLQRKQSRNVYLTPSDINPLIITKKYFDKDYSPFDIKDKHPQVNIINDKKKRNIQTINHKNNSVKNISALPRLDESLKQKQTKIFHSMNKYIFTNIKSSKNKQIMPLSLKKKQLVLQRELYDVKFDNKILKELNDIRISDHQALSLLTKEPVTKSNQSNQTECQYDYKRNGNSICNTLLFEKHEEEKKDDTRPTLATNIYQRKKEETTEKKNQKDKEKFNQSLVIFKKKPKKQQTVLSISEIKNQNEKQLNEYIKDARKHFLNSIKDSAKKIVSLKSQMFTVLQEAKEDYDNQLFK